MDVIEAIMTRRSIRKYQDKPVEKEKVRTLMEAAMAAPSAGNSQPWQFLLITERALLDKLSAVHPYVGMLKQSPLAVLVCGDPSLEKFQGNWPLDCSAAVQNILLAARGVGLGTVWTGLYPDEARMEAVQDILRLPESIKPHTLIPVGYPAQDAGRADRYKQERVHENGW